MASPPAISYGNYYHIYNRGNNGETIFTEKDNFAFFLQLYAKYLFPIADTYAYCLMRNHFHFLVRIKEIKLLDLKYQKKKPGLIFGDFFNAYAKAFNNRYHRSGSLFEHPFGRKQVESSAHLIHLVAYIHQNPQNHGYVDDFRDWPYSSYHALNSTKPTRLAREVVIDWFGDLSSLEDLHNFKVTEEVINTYFLEESNFT